MVAARGVQVEVVELLIKAGADINLIPQVHALVANSSPPFLIVFSHAH